MPIQHLEEQKSLDSVITGLKTLLVVILQVVDLTIFIIKINSHNFETNVYLTPIHNLNVLTRLHKTAIPLELSPYLQSKLDACDKGLFVE